MLNRFDLTDINNEMYVILNKVMRLERNLTAAFSARRKDATFNADDTLFRGLLSLPQEPAVMRVSVFALAFADMARGLTAGLMLSHFFDVPVIR